MLVVLCIVIMLAVGYSMLNEGLFSAVTMLVNVMLAGFMTYSLWEPAADSLESMTKGTFMDGMEDHLAMMLLFAVFLGGLRFATSSLAKSEVQFNPNLNRFGGAFVGLLIGYLVSGFLVCAMETLPLSDNFLGFRPRADGEGLERSIFPPDRVWSALMRRAGAFTLSWKSRAGATDAYDRYKTFDPNGNFELRYLRYRRYVEKDGKKIGPMPWPSPLEFKAD